MRFSGGGRGGGGGAVELLSINCLLKNVLEKIFLSLTGPIFLIGLVGNGIVVAVITTLRRRGQKSSVQLFLLHLAISDLLVCLLCIPLTIFTNFHYPAEYYKADLGLCKLSRFMQVCLNTILRHQKSGFRLSDVRPKPKGLL